MSDKISCKELTKTFFEKIKNELNDYEININIYDVLYYDGYFIYSEGKDSCVNFKIKECPGWLFGLWWNFNSETNKFKGDFFAQYEDNINKFKPSASCIEQEFEVKEEYNSALMQIGKIIKFIKEEPAIAFCQDNANLDLNVDYISREEAEKEFKAFKKSRFYEKKYLNKLEKELLRFFNKYFKEDIQDNILGFHKMNNTDPKYDLILNIDNYNKRYWLPEYPSESKLTEGCIVSFEDLVSKEMQRKYHRIFNKYRRIKKRKHFNMWEKSIFRENLFVECFYNERFLKLNNGGDDNKC